IAAHIRMATAERVARGEHPDDASAAARREFGNVTMVRDVTRAMWRGARFHRAADEFRIALRTLRRTPRFSVAAMLCIALGIGATTTIFSTLYSVLLSPLPYPNAGLTVAIHPVNSRSGSAGASITPAEIDSWRRARTVSSLSAWRANNNDLV